MAPEVAKNCGDVGIDEMVSGGGLGLGILEVFPDPENAVSGQGGDGPAVGTDGLGGLLQASCFSDHRGTVVTG